MSLKEKVYLSIAVAMCLAIIIPVVLAYRDTNKIMARDRKRKLKN